MYHSCILESKRANSLRSRQKARSDSLRVQISAGKAGICGLLRIKLCGYTAE